MIGVEEMHEYVSENWPEDLDVPSGREIGWFAERGLDAGAVSKFCEERAKEDVETPQFLLMTLLDSHASVRAHLATAYQMGMIFGFLFAERQR